MNKLNCIVDYLHFMWYVAKIILSLENITAKHHHHEKKIDKKDQSHQQVNIML